MLADVEVQGEEAVAAIRLLMPTDFRLGEIQTLRLEDVDLEAAEPWLRDSRTGARMVLRSATAIGVLSALPRIEHNPWVITGRKAGAARLTEVQHPWQRIRARADFDDVRFHDPWALLCLKGASAG